MWSKGPNNHDNQAVLDVLAIFFLLLSQLLSDWLLLRTGCGWGICVWDDHMKDIPFHSHHNGKKAEILALMQMFAAVVSAHRNHRVLVAENYFEYNKWCEDLQRLKGLEPECRWCAQLPSKHLKWQRRKSDAQHHKNVRWTRELSITNNVKL